MNLKIGHGMSMRHLHSGRQDRVIVDYYSFVTVCAIFVKFSIEFLVLAWHQIYQYELYPNGNKLHMYLPLAAVT